MVERKEIDERTSSFVITNLGRTELELKGQSSAIDHNRGVVKGAYKIFLKATSSTAL